MQARKAENLIAGQENEKDIVGEAERLDIKEKAPMVLAELLLDVNILAQIKTYRNLFLRVRVIEAACVQHFVAYN